MPSQRKLPDYFGKELRGSNLELFGLLESLLFTKRNHNIPLELSTRTKNHVSLPLGRLMARKSVDTVTSAANKHRRFYLFLLATQCVL